MRGTAVARSGEQAVADTAEPDVRRLVERAQRGERDAFEELYVIHFDRIFGYLQLSVGNRHDAEDLTNQTFIRMLESIDRFGWRSVPFSAWLFRIAHNLAMDHFRAGRRWQPERSRRRMPPRSSHLPRTRRSTGSADDRMLRLIDGLSGDQRQVLTLKFGFDFSNAEVAAILGKTEGAVKALQHRAFATLQRSLTAAQTS